MLSEHVKFSIIIPVYNVEEYIEKCISSCYNQNLPVDQYQVIAVNDGSKDSSLKKLIELKEHNFDNDVVILMRGDGFTIADKDDVYGVYLPIQE